MSNRPTDTRRISDDALETGKLIVELINTGYVSRRRAGAAVASDASISPHAIRAAIHLYQHGEVSVSELAAGVGISRGWASRVVEELERAGYVERERSAADRRIVRVRLSDASATEIERVYRWRGDAVDAALAPFDPSERAVIRAFLNRVVEELRQAADLDSHLER